MHRIFLNHVLFISGNLGKLPHVVLLGWLTFVDHRELGDLEKAMFNKSSQLKEITRQY